MAMQEVCLEEHNWGTSFGMFYFPVFILNFPLDSFGVHSSYVPFSSDDNNNVNSHEAHYRVGGVYGEGGIYNNKITQSGQLY